MIVIAIVILVLVLVFVAAAVQMTVNRHKLAEMDRLIDHFQKQTFADEQGKEVAKTLLRKRLIKLKSQILADQRSLSIAADKIAYL